MKQAIAIPLIFLINTFYGQTNSNQVNKTDKSILITCLKSSGTCGYKALKIVKDSVLIDTCYNNKAKNFTTDKLEILSSNILYSTIANTMNSQWMQIESDINKITTCDFAVPYEIFLVENSKTSTFTLKRIMNCYPESAKTIMEGLDKYFEKLQ